MQQKKNEFRTVEERWSSSIQCCVSEMESRKQFLPGSKHPTNTAQYLTYSTTKKIPPPPVAGGPFPLFEMNCLSDFPLMILQRRLFLCREDLSNSHMDISDGHIGYGPYHGHGPDPPW